MRFLDRHALGELEFAACGVDVNISERAILYGTRHMSIGSHVRIDDLAIVSAGAPVTIGSYVHIGAHSFLAGRNGITLEDFSGIGSYVAIFTASEDFSGATLANPTVPARYKSLAEGRVHVGRHAMVATHSTVLPGVTIADGAVAGSHSLVNRDLEGWVIYGGSPVRRLKERSRDLLELEQQLLAEDIAPRGGPGG